MGRGGFGSAHLMLRREDEKLVAVKKIGASADFVEMTDNDIQTAEIEAIVLKNLNFVHIVK